MKVHKILWSVTLMYVIIFVNILILTDHCGVAKIIIFKIYGSKLLSQNEPIIMHDS